MKGEYTFQCGTCCLIEFNISQKDLIELSIQHMNGNHLDINELNEQRKQNDNGVGK